MVKRLDGNSFDDHKSKREERKSAPSLHQVLTGFSQFTRVDTIHKSVEIKIQSKETGRRKSVIFIFFVLLTRQLTSWIPIISRWRCLCSSDQTADRPNARRISAPEQDSFPPESSRIRYERSTAGSLFSVGFPVLLDLLVADFIPSRYPNLYEVRLIPTKRDIAFVEFVDEGSAGVAKDALHNYKLDGENKIKVRCFLLLLPGNMTYTHLDYIR